MKNLLKVGGCVALLWLVSCAPARFVEPLDKGEVAVAGSLGGPALQVGGTPLVTPLSSVVAGYGVSDKLTVFGGAHLTAAAFGVIQTEWGATYDLLQPEENIAGLSIGLNTHTAVDVWEGKWKFWPQVEANLRWPAGKNLIYAGASNWFEPSPDRYLGEEQHTHLIPSIQLGYIIKGARWNIGFEGKFIAPTERNDGVAVDWIGAGNTGAFGLYVSLQRSWKKKGDDEQE